MVGGSLHCASTASAPYNPYLKACTQSAKPNRKYQEVNDDDDEYLIMIKTLPKGGEIKNQPAVRLAIRLAFQDLYSNIVQYILVQRYTAAEAVILQDLYQDGVLGWV